MRGKSSIMALCLLLVSIFLSSQGVKAQGEWRSISTGITDQVNDVYVPTPGVITIVTNMGNAMHSTNGGQTWNHNQLLPGQSINSVAGFNDPLNMQMPTIATGEDGSMWKSTDGGQNWTRNDLPTSNDMFSVTVDPTPTDPSNVDFWASGQNGTVFHSSNSGNSWQQQSVTYPNENLYGISYANNTHGTIGGNYDILYGTTNGGSTWGYQSSPVSGVDFMGVYRQSSNVGWAVGTNGTIINTSNGGTTWTPQMSGTSQTLTGATFIDENNGMVAGHGGTMLSTTDRGSTWSPVETGYTGDFQSITTDNEGNYWASGTEGALLTNAPEQQSTFSVDRSQLNYGAVANGGSTGNDALFGQNVSINKTGDGTLNWSASGNQTWLNATPSSGTNTGYVSVTVDPTGMAEGTYDGTITVSDVDDGTQSQTVDVTLSVKNGTLSQPPFGSFDTPVDGSTARSSVPVTGWVLDDVGVQSVKLYRSGSNGPVYVGDAALVEGARPDVATSYPDYPNNTKAGWGYMLLTNFLPGGGNGTFTLEAKATDREGNETSLGTKTIHCDNANAVKPFGAIDAPAAGGTASGSAFRNTGWALTPMPNKIPTDGSTINVYVDGQNIGHPIYNNYRSDIACLFPCYANSRGAHAYFDFNTTAYSNGVHTIQWTAQDNAGNSDGIGSRYFSVTNNGGRYISGDDLGSGTPFLILNSDGPVISLGISKLVFGGIVGGGNISGSKFNFTTGTMNAGTPHTQTLQINNSGGSALNWEASSDQAWISIDPSTGTAPGWLAVIINPAGLDAGTHTGYVTISEGNDACPPQHVEVELNVYAQSEFPFGEFSYPDFGRSVSGTITMSGWALDDIGVESVQIFRQDGNDMIPVGDAAFVRDGRPDIAHAYAHYPFNNLASWNFTFPSNSLADGEYYFHAEVTDYEGNTTILEGNNFTIDNANLVVPFGDIDTPTPGEIISGDSYEITGWALAPLLNTIPTDGSTISVFIDGVSVGSPVYNLNRDDIAALFPGYNNSAGPGGIFYLNTTQYEDGVHTIAWSAADDQGNTNETIGSREFVIQNNSNITVDVDEDAGLEIPKETELSNAYPNPFNPTTNINFKLASDENVSLIVFDILGRKITSLLDNEFKPAGSYKLYWYGKDSSGHRLSSGVYLVMMKAGNYMKTQKLMLLR